MKYKIYTLTDPITLKIRYVGKTKMELRSRVVSHMVPCNLKSKTHKNHWLRKLRADNLLPIWDVLDETDSAEFANDLERYWIAQLKNWNFDLVNGTAGGDGGFTGFRKHTDATKKKISESQLGKKLSEAHKKLISTSMSKIMIGNKRAVGSKGWVGKTHKQTTKDKCKLNHPFRKVVIMCDENNVEIKRFDSIYDAVRATGILKTTISRCCQGRPHYKTGGGFIWKFFK